MKLLIVTVAALLFAAHHSAVILHAAEVPIAMPNVVLIFADDK
jgi:hypothetical protein